ITVAVVAAMVVSVMVIAIVVISVAIVSAAIVPVAIPVAARGLELSRGAEIAVAGQDLPLIRSAGLQACKLNRVLGATTLLVRRTPVVVIAADDAIAHVVRAFRIGDPADG